MLEGNSTISFIESLGFLTSKDESSLTPQYQITYLGFVLNSIDMSVQPSDEKVTSLQIQLDAAVLQQNYYMYVSRYKDSEACCTDAASSLGLISLHIFPPFSITCISRVLNKIEIDEADFVVIVPCWKTQV